MAAQENSYTSSNSEISDVLNDMDEYLDEALEDEEDEEYLTPVSQNSPTFFHNFLKL